MKYGRFYSIFFIIFCVIMLVKHHFYSAAAYGGIAIGMLMDSDRTANPLRQIIVWLAYGVATAAFGYIIYLKFF